MAEWWKRPKLIEYWDEEFDTIMAIDENGTTDLQGIRKNLVKLFTPEQDFQDRWFTITGVVISRECFPQFREDMTSLKTDYWQEGNFDYKAGSKRVVFHSREIRKRVGPFNPKLIDIFSFMEDLSDLISTTPFTTFSASIDKAMHVLKYSNPYPVYNLCLEFILERYCRLLREQGKTGMLLLESRGKKEDKLLLKYIVGLLNNGNRYWNKNDFSCIKGVYFNPKWDRPGNGSFILLELADLVSYPIHKYLRSDVEDKSFSVVQQKLHNYPHFFGYGLKKFP
jgi:hypothetical protein